MRKLALCAALAALLTATDALAGPLAVRAVAVDPALEKKFDEDYGRKDLADLQEEITRDLTRSFTAHGATIVEGADIAFEATLVDATPGKPTFKQLSDKPGLDYTRSISRGGARLTGQFVDSTGKVLATVKGQYYATDLFHPPPVSTWGEASSAFQSFAEKAGKTYQRRVDQH